MRVFAQSSRCPSQVLFAFDDIATSDVKHIRWAVAYTTYAGCDRLVKRIIDRIGAEKWNDIDKQFVTSLDFGLTEPNALEYLKKIPKSKVFVANPVVANRPGFRPARAYHPKLYLFDGPSKSGYVVGSANLTSSALISNTEVVIAGNEVPTNGGWDQTWKELLLDATPITDELIKQYRENWKRPAVVKHFVEPEPKPTEPVIIKGQKKSFWSAIESEAVSPQTFDHLWIEAGSMSSGGSHNQLELPRGANRFFGFNHSTYGDEHITIGTPVLTLKGSRWSDRPLTWHGNNRMERLNLPTMAQGGFDYRNTTILFRRHSGGFEIDVLPWVDDGAIAWRAASVEQDTVFLVGERATTRLCGLF